MLVIRIWNYFRGYVIIKVEGLTLERFINLATTRNIFLWDIVRLDYTTLETKVSTRGFKELKEVVTRVGCRVNIEKKRGFPFLVHKFRYRKMLFFGFIIAVSIIIFLTSFIWSIDIIGNEKIEDNAINKHLISMGIKTGTMKHKVDIDALKDTLIFNIEGLSYVNAEIRGTKLIVEIREKDMPVDTIEETTPCNIVAIKKAVIEKVIAKSGRSQVEKGDIVKEGQLLIAGKIDNERMEEPIYVHSKGTVIGRTWYSKTIEEPITKPIKEETGRVFTSKEIKIGEKRIQLLNGEIPFDNYIEEVQTKKLINTEVFQLPFEIILHRYKEVNVKRVTQNVDALKKSVAVRGVQQVMNIIPDNAQVVSKDVKYSIADNILITNITIEVLEEIGRKEEIYDF